MTAVKYQVVIVHRAPHYYAYLMDLDCEGQGTTAQEAVAKVTAEAMSLFGRHQSSTYTFPPPSQFTLATIELRVD